MVGLNGVVVKSHGGTDALGFAHAVDVAMDMVVHRFNDRIREDLGASGLDKRSPAQIERAGPSISSTAVLAGEPGEAAVSGGAARRGSSDGTHLATA